MNWLDYREQLGIGFSDENKFNMLKNRILTFVEHLDNRDYGYISYLRYNTIVCERTNNISDVPFLLQESFESTSNLADLVYKYIAFYNMYLPGDSQYSDEFKESILRFLEQGLLFLKIQYKLVKDEDGIFIFPKGAKELDDALVSQPLEWLKDYPNAYKTYCTALRQYSEGVYIRDVADNLRKSLEDFLREFLNNEKDLNSNKKLVEAYLKKANANPQLVNMFGSLLTHYYLLNNDIAKHNDKVDKTYLEFLLYQTGIFIRMLIVVKQEYKEASHAD